MNTEGEDAVEDEKHLHFCLRDVRKTASDFRLTCDTGKVAASLRQSFFCPSFFCPMPGRLLRILVSRGRIDTVFVEDTLSSQDRARWDRLLIRRGLAALERARRRGGEVGPYVLQAEIAACHARAVTVETTDWARIASLYATLAEVMPSPVVELNRAMAVAMASGPAAGLALVDVLVAAGALDGYHLLPSVRGDLLQKLGRAEEAGEEFERAATLTRNEREKALLMSRAMTCHLRAQS